MTPIPTLEWTGKAVKLLDQTRLPGRVAFLTIRTEQDMFDAIRRLAVRGAPAIGVAAAYGLYLGTARRKPATLAAVRRTAATVAAYLGRSRPTAVNLFWALEQCRAALEALPDTTSAQRALAALLEKARELERDDARRCAAMARHGAVLLRGAAGVLTHCNAGALATAGCGTAVGVILEAHKRSPFTVYVDETRPLLQGARLTAWELQQAGVDYRLITDSMAATAMQRGLVHAVVVGADRIAANGDAANKIGTMPLALVAHHFRVPFYVAAPLSTVDFALRTGALIPIEERDDREITHLGEHPIAPRGTRTFNPAFDVTPAKFITAIVTEQGVIRAPFGPGLRKARAAAQGKSSKRPR